MLKIGTALLGIFLLSAGWFILSKGAQVFILQPEQLSEQQLQRFQQFFRRSGWFYIILGLLSFCLILIHEKFLYAGFVVVVAFFTAFFSLQLGNWMKKE